MQVIRSDLQLAMRHNALQAVYITDGRNAMYGTQWFGSRS